MILRNISFENDLVFKEDHICTILAETPGLFARVVQSMAALEAGCEPPEPFMFLEGEKEINAQKMLLLITDPYHLDLNSRKNLAALYAKLEESLAADVELQSEWLKLTVQAALITEQLTRNLFADVFPGDEPPYTSWLKESGVRFAFSEDMDFKDRMLGLMDIVAELMPQRLMICCNIFSYCDSDTWYELMKYACYLKLRLLDIERVLPEKLYEHEIRWVIHSNYDDEIQKG